jgi:hypothetical protein
MIKQNIGIVGATGSLESQYTNFIIAHQQNELSHGNLLHRLNVYVEQIKFKHYFDPFPNHHLRTNGFMISRNIISKIDFRPLHDKMDAHRFESGKNSLTKQILQMGLDILVVGKNGQGYHKDEWCRSGTFRQGEQINLLIADNQTNTYLHADPELREMLSHLAWGD